MGYDVTMHRTSEVETQSKAGVDEIDHVYVIEVYEEGRVRKFRTTTSGLISGHGAHLLLGRGTWVCVVQEILESGFGPERILKDTWIDGERLREGNVIREIRERLKADGKEALLHHFLTPETHGDVLIDGQLDSSHALLHRGQSLSSSAYLRVSRTPTNVVVSDVLPAFAPSDGATPHVANPSLPKAHRAPRDRQHYRIIFEERGETLHSLGDRHLMLLALAGAMIGRP